MRTVLENRLRRKERVRRHLRADGKPRLSVFRSLQHIWAQIIDDASGKTLVAASDLELKEGKGSKLEKAALVGELLAKKAGARKIRAVVFDRGGYRFHGRVKVLAESARAKGLDF